ncbi:MAG: sporulation initiation factor Spo0A C-terminal domain-containing protein [Lachnospiraceae bacterium]
MNQIQLLIHCLGISATYRGYHYLSYALELVFRDEDILLCIGKSLYPPIAKKYNATPSSVERNLRTVITLCWEHGNRKFLNSISAYPLCHKPSIGEFIDILVMYLKISH